jgi:hypothetical protein
LDQDQGFQRTKDPQLALCKKRGSWCLRRKKEMIKQHLIFVVLSIIIVASYFGLYRLDVLTNQDGANMVRFFLLLSAHGLVLITGFVQIIWYLPTKKMKFKLLNFAVAYQLVSSVVIAFLTRPITIQLSHHVRIIITLSFYLFIWYYAKSTLQKGL